MKASLTAEQIATAAAPVDAAGRMADDPPMGWEPGIRRQPESAPAPAERRVWLVVKAARSVQAIERDHPHGRELRIVYAGSLLWSQLFRLGDVPTLEAVAAERHADMLSRGWEPGE